MTACWRIATPRSRPAALAAIDLWAGSPAELEAALTRIAGRAPAAGRISLRPMLGIDIGIVARIDATHATLMPHGGPAVLDALAEALNSAGLTHTPEPAARERFPEAGSDVEAEMLAALARAPSPLAVDLLLDQPRRWQGRPAGEPTERDRRLNRLIDPPLVAAVGPPNVGKSSLLNALVGRSAALVADEPGTTRDHIGATIDLAGLVVHWVDTPGRRAASGVEARAIEASEAVIASADLVLAVGDAGSADPRAVLPREADLVVASRSDLGLPAWGYDQAVSARTGEGLAGLVERIRDALVPPADLQSADPWRFFA